MNHSNNFNILIIIFPLHQTPLLIYNQFGPIASHSQNKWTFFLLFFRIEKYNVYMQTIEKLQIVSDSSLRQFITVKKKTACQILCLFTISLVKLQVTVKLRGLFFFIVLFRRLARYVYAKKLNNDSLLQ